MLDLTQLTKKNQEFIHIASNQLRQDGKSEEEIQAILTEVFPSILEHQAKGETARHFLGAPTAWATSFTPKADANNQDAEPKNTNPWFMWLDMTLFFAGIVALINIIMTLFNREVPATRLLSLLVISGMGGLAMYLNYHYLYRHLGKPKEERPSLLKGGLVFAGVVIVWTLLSAGTSLLPNALNPELPVLILAIIGASALAARQYLQKKYNIQNALTSHVNGK